MGCLLAVAGGSGFLAALSARDLVPALVVAGHVGAVAGWSGLAVVRDPAPTRSLRQAGNLAVRPLILVGGVVAAVTLAPGSTVRAPLHLLDGWAGLRDGHVPASVVSAPDGAVLAVPVTLVVLAAAVTTWSARSRGWGLLSWSPSLAVMVLGFVVGDERHGAPLWTAVAWGLLVLVSATWGRSRSVPVTAGLVLVLVAMISVQMGDRVPLDGERLRLARSGGVQPDGSDQPLTLMEVLRSGPDEPMFSVDAAWPVARWRLAALDGYDGINWYADHELRPASRELPASLFCPAPEADMVTHQVDLDPSTVAAGGPAWGPWLPTPEGTAEISVDGLLYDRESGALRPDDDRSAPAAYDVVARLVNEGAVPRTEARAAEGPEEWTARQLPPADRSPARARMLADLDQLAADHSAGASTDYGRAVALSQLMLDGELVDDQGSEAVDQGVALATVHSFLTSVGDGPRQGTPEQFVTGFTLLARSAGLPTRVVVGFEGSAATGRYVVTAHQATTWAEVCFEDLGWVPFDIVPSETGRVLPPAPPTPTPDDRQGGTSDVADREDLGTPEAGGDSSDARDEVDGGTGTGASESINWWHLAVGLAPAALLVATARGPLRRWSRVRRRRKAASPAARVAGAWLTVVDDLRVAGVAPEGAAAAARIVALARRYQPAIGEPMTELGLLANRSAFSRRPTPTGDAERAWRLADSVIATRRRLLPAHRRWREFFRR